MSNYLLGDFVRKSRTEKGLSLREFGKLCEISHTTIDVIEKGYDPRTGKPVNITNNTFEKLSAGLGVSVSTLVNLSNGTQKKTITIEDDGLDELDMKFIAVFKRLSVQEKKMLLVQAEALLQLRGQ